MAWPRPVSVDLAVFAVDGADFGVSRVTQFSWRSRRSCPGEAPAGPRCLCGSVMLPVMQDLNGKTPLHYATEQKQSEIVHALLDAGADPNIRERIYGNTPLSQAVLEIVEPGDPVIVKMIDHGGDPTIANDYGQTPLSSARSIARSCVPLLEAAAANNKQD